MVERYSHARSFRVAHKMYGKGRRPGVTENNLEQTGKCAGAMLTTVLSNSWLACFPDLAVSGLSY